MEAEGTELSQEKNRINQRGTGQRDGKGPSYIPEHIESKETMPENQKY